MALPPPPLTQAAARADPAMYTACYCEENVLQLARALGCTAPPDGLALPPAYAVVVSNGSRACPVWHQRAGPPEGPVVWDYHVVLLARAGAPGEGWLVWDLDTTLPFPSPFDAYADAAFRPGEPLIDRYRQRFRVVPAHDYARVFASDRRHMRREGGGWSSPPPAYPPLRGPAADSDWTLGRLWDVTPAAAAPTAAGGDGYGTTMGLEELLLAFGGAASR